VVVDEQHANLGAFVHEFSCGGPLRCVVR
jgi:hypothetical protein